MAVGMITPHCKRKIKKAFLQYWATLSIKKSKSVLNSFVEQGSRSTDETLTLSGLFLLLFLATAVLVITLCLIKWKKFTTSLSNEVCNQEKHVWVARKPPGYAFVEFDDRRDALDAIRALDGKNGWRVELSHNSKSGGGGRGGGGRGRGGGDDMKCYECGEPGHFARECRLRVGSGGMGSGRRRSPSPRYRRSPSYGRRSYSPRGRRSPPRRRSASPRRERSLSRSPAYNHAPHDSPYANGSPVARDRRRSRT